MVRVRFLLFYYELTPLTRDVTCSSLYFYGKYMRWQCQMNTLWYISVLLLSIKIEIRVSFKIISENFKLMTLEILKIP